MSKYQILTALAPYRGAVPHPTHSHALTDALADAAADRAMFAPSA